MGQRHKSMKSAAVGMFPYVCCRPEFKTRVTLALILLLTNAGSAAALPALKDFWHLTCAPLGVTRALQESSQAKIGQGGGIGDLHAACVQSALEEEAHEKKMTQFNDAGGKGKAPVFDNRRSLDLLKSAKAKLEASYEVKKSPLVGYHFGFALALLADDWSINRLDEAQRGLKGTEIAGNSYLVLGEIYFDKQTFDKAAEYYKKALVDAADEHKDYAKYKLAWLDYLKGLQPKNPAVQRKAIQELAQVSKRLSNANGIAKGIGLKAKEDVLSMIVTLGDLAAAKQILQSVEATDLYGTLLERMAYTKMSEGNAKSAYDLFGLSIKERPLAETAVELAINQTTIAGQANNIPLVVSNLKTLVRSYIQPKAPWRKKQKKPALKKWDGRIEALFADYTTAIDRQGRDTKNATVLGQTETLYKIFLKYFPKSAKAYDMQFYLGQLLYFMQKNEPAARALEKMVKAQPKGKYTKDALEIMVTAAQTALDADKTAYSLPQPGKGLEELKIPTVRKTYADSLDIFVKLMPQHANAPDMQFAAASVYYDFAHYDDGIKRYKSFIRKHPTSSYSVTVVARILEYYKYNEKPAALEQVKREIAEIPTLGTDPALKAALAPAKEAKESKAAKVAAEESEESDDSDESSNRVGSTKTVKASQEDEDE